MSEPIHIISLGAGVQSSTMALMAAAGEITPMPVAAIFADTQDEPASVYTWLDWLEKQLPFPIIRVTKGKLSTRVTTPYYSQKNHKVTTGSIPAFILNPDGSGSIMPRQCTRDFKIDPITKAINALRRERGRVPAIVWIGISLDEIGRAKEHRNAPRIKHRHPLLDLRLRRPDCLKWMAENGYPTPPRSACVFCPYHNNAEWRRLKQFEPEDFARAVAFEKELQRANHGASLKGTPFLHRSLVPLDQVDLSTDVDRGQGLLNGFQNECEGMCGV